LLLSCGEGSPILGKRVGMAGEDDKIMISFILEIPECLLTNISISCILFFRKTFRILRHSNIMINLFTFLQNRKTFS
jgi:hypothetical protein